MNDADKKSNLISKTDDSRLPWMKGGNPAPVRRTPKSLRILLGVVGVILIGAILSWLATGGERKPRIKEEPKARPKTTKVAKPLPHAPQQQPVKAATAESVVKPEQTVPDSERVVATLNVYTNVDGSVTERYRTADGKTHSIKRAAKRIFQDATDDLIAMAISSANAGTSLPPMPMGDDMDAQFRKSLEHAIIPYEDDPKDIQELKRKVNEVRIQIKELMDQGESFASIMRQHQDIVNASVPLRDFCQRELRKMLDAGDRQGAEAYLKEANKKLENFGYEAVSMPESSAERRARIRAEHGKTN